MITSNQMKEHLWNAALAYGHPTLASTKLHQACWHQVCCWTYHSPKRWSQPHLKQSRKKQNREREKKREFFAVTLSIFSAFAFFSKEDAGLELNISKTAVLSKAITQQALFDVAHAFIIDSPQLTQLSGELNFPLTPSSLTALWVSVYLLVQIILFGNL